jgi:micrococcal nuclease
MRRGLGSVVGSVALLLLLAIVVLGPDSPEPRPGSLDEARRSVRAHVARVIDGDTIEVLIDGRTEDVRYIGIDTPETVKEGTPVQCFGSRASEFNHRLVEGRTVRLVFDREHRDIYGRLLAYVYLRGQLVNAELVRRGLARTLTIAPNLRFAALFAHLEQAAGRAGRGLWGFC